MALPQAEFDAFVIEANKATESQAGQIKDIMHPENDPVVEVGGDFGQGLINGVSAAAVLIRDMSVEQRTAFGPLVSTVAITENQGNSDPGT